MKTTTFRGDSTDISAKKEALSRTTVVAPSCQTPPERQRPGPWGRQPQTGAWRERLRKTASSYRPIPPAARKMGGQTEMHTASFLDHHPSAASPPAKHTHKRWSFSSQSIHSYVTREIKYFHDQINIFIGSKHPKNKFNLILKKLDYIQWKDVWDSQTSCSCIQCNKYWNWFLHAVSIYIVRCTYQCISYVWSTAVSFKC